MLVFGLGLRMYLRICWGFQKDDRGEEQEASPQDDLDLKQSRLSDTDLSFFTTTLLILRYRIISS